MIEKRITLKFADGRRESITVVTQSEADFAVWIQRTIAKRGAYGFSTQSRVVYMSAGF